MKKRRLFLTLALGLSLTLATLWILATRGSSAVAMPSAGNVKAPNAPVAELHVCPAGCAYSSIQAAVDAANDGDAIKVAAGTYTGVSARAGVTQVVYISKSISIQGGYTTTNWTTPYPITQPTTLNAQGQGRVLYITGEISPTVEGLRLTGGNAAGLDGADDCDAGGGVYMSIRMGVFSNNWVFSNTAACGGGLYLSGGAPTLSNNTVMSNTANGNFNGVGGGLYLYWSDAALAGNTISFNAANYGGGGLFVHGGAPTFTGNTVAFNIAVNGGGLYCEEALIATLTGNTISFNTATEYGGGLSMYSAATLSGNTVFSNTAAQAGGGLYLDFGGSMLDATLVNNLVADNQANSQGSGLYLVKVPLLRLVHTTITRNRGGDGSGVYVDLESSLIMTNTILVGQTVGITVTSGSAATLEGTLWGSGAWANGANWGGAGTIIMGTINVLGDPDFVNPAGGNYHLGAGSAAVDAGVAGGVATDIDGDPRPAAFGYDIGADERPGASLQLRQTAWPAVLDPGQMATYTLAITNAGVNTATNVWMSDSMPALQQALTITTDRGTCTITMGWGGTAVCGLGAMAPGDITHITLAAQVTPTLTAPLPLLMRNTVWVTATEASNTTYIDTALQDCHVRLNDGSYEYNTFRRQWTPPIRRPTWSRWLDIAWA